MTNKVGPARKPLRDRKYNGKTLNELQEMVLASNASEQGIDEIAGDSAAGAAYIAALVAEVRRLRSKIENAAGALR